jgi:hypothetical protein
LPCGCVYERLAPSVSRSTTRLEAKRVSSKQTCGASACKRGRSGTGSGAGSGAWWTSEGIIEVPLGAELHRDLVSTRYDKRAASGRRESELDLLQRYCTKTLVLRISLDVETSPPHGCFYHTAYRVSMEVDREPGVASVDETAGGGAVYPVVAHVNEVRIAGSGSVGDDVSRLGIEAGGC